MLQFLMISTRNQPYFEVDFIMRSIVLTFTLMLGRHLEYSSTTDVTNCFFKFDNAGISLGSLLMNSGPLQRTADKRAPVCALIRLSAWSHLRNVVSAAVPGF